GWLRCRQPLASRGPSESRRVPGGWRRAPPSRRRPPRRPLRLAIHAPTMLAVLSGPPRGHPPAGRVSDGRYSGSFRHLNLYSCSTPGRAFDAQPAPESFHALAHAWQTESIRSTQGRIESYAVVGDFQTCVAVEYREPHRDPCCMRVLQHIIESLLRNPI